TLNLSPTTNISHGQSVTVTASVTPNSGTGTPTGDVSLTAQTGSSSSGQTLVDSFSLTSGSINLPTHLLPGGTNYTVTAHYAGDASFKPSSSTAVSVTIAKGSTATVLTSSSSSVGQGSSVTLTTTVNTNSLGDAPEGTVTFFSGTTQLGSAPAFGGFNS